MIATATPASSAAAEPREGLAQARARLLAAVADGRGAAARRERPREAAAHVALREVAERAAEVVAEPRPEEVGRGPRRGLRGRNARADGVDRRLTGTPSAHGRRRLGLARDRARAADRPAPRRHPRRRRRVREAGRRRAPFAAPAVEGRDRRVLFLGGFGARRFGARRFGGFLAPDFSGI